MPVPCVGEHTTDGSEASERLGAVSAEEILHVAYISREDVTSVLDTSRETLEEAVAYVRYLIVGHRRSETELEVLLLIV